MVVVAVVVPALAMVIISVVVLINVIVAVVVGMVVAAVAHPMVWAHSLARKHVFTVHNGACPVKQGN